MVRAYSTNADTGQTFKIAEDARLTCSRAESDHPCRKDTVQSPRQIGSAGRAVWLPGGIDVPGAEIDRTRARGTGPRRQTRSCVREVRERRSVVSPCLPRWDRAVWLKILLATQINNGVEVAPAFHHTLKAEVTFCVRGVITCLVRRRSSKTTSGNCSVDICSLKVYRVSPTISPLDCPRWSAEYETNRTGNHDSYPTSRGTITENETSPTDVLRSRPPSERKRGC
jgi:hypothetical protein